LLTTTIVKWGNSRGVRLPKLFLENLDIKENDAVDIVAENGAIVIKKSVKYKQKTLKQRLEEFHGEDLDSILIKAGENPETPVMIDWGRPMGEEAW